VNDYVCSINYMSKYVQIVAVVCVLMGFGSCKKCHQCAIYDKQTSDETLFTAYSEICGSNKDIKAYEGLCEDRVVAEMEATDAGSIDLYCDCGQDIVIE